MLYEQKLSHASTRWNNKKKKKWTIKRYWYFIEFFILLLLRNNKLNKKFINYYNDLQIQYLFLFFFFGLLIDLIQLNQFFLNITNINNCIKKKKKKLRILFSKFLFTLNALLSFLQLWIWDFIMHKFIKNQNYRVKINSLVT